MASLLERKLVVVTGKGGTGKTTVACALGLIGARRGLRTIVAEIGAQRRLATLFGVPGGEEVRVGDRLWSASIDPDRAMIEWLGAIGGRLSARVLAASSTFQYFAAAAPGAKELVTLRRVIELCEGSSARRENARADTLEHYDLVVLDAPATGHALGMLRAPWTFATIARVGPMVEQTRRVQEMLEDRSRCAYVAVAHASEMAVTETLELERQLRQLLERDLDAVFVNGTYPQRFTREELDRMERELLDFAEHESPDRQAIARTASRSARSGYARARGQQNQIARLRRERFDDGAPPRVLTIPFQFGPEMFLAAFEAIAERLAGRV
ncbi:MAG: ArsA family ATPase [Solirubrobacteraceae bacterium]